MIRAISCDLDGTLLDRAAHIRPASARALLHLSMEGIMVILASGRSYRTVVSIQKKLGVRGPIVAHNGAYGYDTALRQEWHRRAVPAKRARQLLDWADHNAVMMRCYLGVDQPVLFNHFDLAHQLCWLKPEDRMVPDLTRTLDADPLELFLTGLDAVDKLTETFGLRDTDYEFTILPHVGYREVNICAPGVDKVEALEQLVRRWGIRRDEILAVGDGLNDVEMLQWAGRSVAIGDGHPLARQAADFVTTPGHPEPVLEGLAWAFPHYTLSAPAKSV